MSARESFLGCRVQMMASDHPYAKQTGRVVADELCAVCKEKGYEDCGYPDLIVELDDGTRTKVYEPEARVVSGEDGEEG